MTNTKKKASGDRPTYRPPRVYTPEEAQQKCDDFNRGRKVGDACRYFPIKGRDELFRDTRLRTLAYLPPSNIPVAMVEGVSGYVSIENLTFGEKEAV